MRRRNISVSVLIAAAISASHIGNAQDVTNATNTGYPENAILHGSDIETVQTTNGDLHVQIPIWKAKGRGLDTGGMYVYDNREWFLKNRCYSSGICEDLVSAEPQSNMVLTAHGPLDYYTSYKGYSYQCSNTATSGVTNVVLREPDGTKHHFSPDPASLPSQDLCGFTTDTNTLYADDGSGWMIVLDPTYGLPSYAVRKDGTTVGGLSGLGSSVIEDSNGNEISAGSPSTDTLGRQIYGGATYLDSSGTQRSATITGTTSVTLSTQECQFSSEDECVEETNTWTVPSTLTLPNGMQYTFGYAQNAGAEITSITLPSGGQITYGYGDWQLGGRPVASRTVTANGTNATWTYTPYSTYTIMSDPYGNDTVLDCNAIDSGDPCYPHYADYYSGSHTSGTLLKTETTDYTTLTLGTAGLIDANTITLPIRTTTTWNQTNQVMKVENDWDTAGVAGGTTTWKNVLERREYDYGNGAPGQLLRRTHYNYLHLQNSTYLNANITDRPTSKVVYDGAGNTLAQRSYQYDGTAVSGPTSAPGHDYTSYSVSNNVRGNLTLLSQWRNTDGAWLNTSYTYNDLGDRLSETDPAGNPTTYGYSDNFTDGANRNTGAFVTQVTEPSVNGVSHVTKKQYYFYSSLVAASCGYNFSGACTNSAGLPQPDYQAFAYDEMLRPSTITRGDGGTTGYSYNDSSRPLSTTVTSSVNSSASETTTTAFDDLGRPNQKQLVSDPCGESLTDTTYDLLGRVASISNPYRNTDTCNAAATGTTHFTNYDIFNRRLSQTQQDGSTLNWAYTGNCVDAYDESGRHSKRCDDALGRLTTVLEPDSSNNPTMETDYRYDGLNDLVQVDQWGGPNGSSGVRQRTFSYDSLGRLLSAYNPETGSTTYSYVTSGGSVCAGDPSLPCSKTNANSVTVNYSYDALNHMTSKMSPSWTRYYIYDIASNGGFNSTYPIGRLVEASNNVNASEQYSYDVMGHVAYQANCIPSNCSQTGNAFYALYDYAGNLSQLTYPDGRVIKYTHDGADRLQTATYDNWNGQHVGYNYLSSATYFPNGSPKALNFGNGSVESTTPNSRLETGEISTQITAPGISEKIFDKQLSYTSSCQTANNGDIVQIIDTLNNNASQAFCYDNLNRIASFSNGDGSMQQTFSIDPWGNVAQYGTESAVLTFGANNRIASSGYGYDSAGNLTSVYNGVTTVNYTYDPEGHVLTANSGSATYTYNPEGDRVRKDSGGDWTEYLYFAGQPLAEKNSDGSWADYIYGDGRRIARADSYDERIHLEGTSNQSGSYAAWNVPVPSYVVQSSDRISWRQYQYGGAEGGIGILFADGTSTNWSTMDTDGQVMNSDTIENSWHYRTVDLSQFAGKTISQMWITADAATPPGSWQMWFSDIAIFGSTGIVTSIYERESSTGLSYFSGGSESNTQGFVERSNSAGDAELPLNTTTYYVGDQIGSARMLTTAGGWPVSSDTFYPYGFEQSGTADPNHYKFSGKQRDAESGLDYFGARFYSDNIGRFMSPDWSTSEDPVPHSALTDPQTLNLYAYVGNNPLNKIDSDGHASGWFSGWVETSIEEAYDQYLYTVLGRGRLSPPRRRTGVAQEQSAQGLAAQVPGQVKTAIMNSVNASNAPSGADTTGGFHEEGGIAGTNSSGELVISPALPGPASHSGSATESLTPADPNLAGTITDLTVSWHVHPSGRNASGGLAWMQPPSAQDQSVAAAEHQALPGLIHIVVGAGNKTVYFYNGNGSYQQMSLKKFMVGAQ